MMMIWLVGPPQRTQILREGVPHEAHSQNVLKVLQRRRLFVIISYCVHIIVYMHKINAYNDILGKSCGTPSHNSLVRFGRGPGRSIIMHWEMSHKTRRRSRYCLVD